jgi:hypothetical protein
MVVNALRANGFEAAQIENWETDPLGTCDAIFPNSRELLEKYGIAVTRRPEISDLGEGAATIGYQPQHHFGTFLEELHRLDSSGGESAVRTMQCPY